MFSNSGVLFWLLLQGLPTALLFLGVIAHVKVQGISIYEVTYCWPPYIFVYALAFNSYNVPVSILYENWIPSSTGNIQYHPNAIFEVVLLPGSQLLSN